MIIFVSSDNDESEFNKYFETMPWCSVPYNNDEKRRDLSAKFEIRGIPSLIVLDGVDASVVDKDGRTTVASGRGDVDKVYAQWAPPVV